MNKTCEDDGILFFYLFYLFFFYHTLNWMFSRSPGKINRYFEAIDSRSGRELIEKVAVPKKNQIGFPLVAATVNGLAVYGVRV